MKTEKRKLADRAAVVAWTIVDSNDATTDKKLRNGSEKTDSFFSKVRKIGKKVGRHTFKVEVKKAEKIATKGEKTRKKGHIFL